MPELLCLGRCYEIAENYRKEKKWFEARAFYTETIIHAETRDVKDLLLDKIALCNKMEKQ